MANLKGKWLFNQSFTGTFDYTITNLFFTSAGMEFDGIHPSGGVSSSSTNKSVMYYKRKDAQVWDVIAQSSYHNYTNGWQKEEFRTVDFGETEQEVSDDFYAWLIANAKKFISGRWIFNDTLVDVYSAVSNQVDAEFTIQDYELDSSLYYSTFHAFSFDMIDFIHDRLCYIFSRKSDGGFVQYNAYTEGVWSTVGGKPANKIDFGEVEQTVPGTFYNWMLNNGHADVSEPITAPSATYDLSLLNLTDEPHIVCVVAVTPNISSSPSERHEYIKPVQTFVIKQNILFNSESIYRQFRAGTTWKQFINSEYNAEQSLSPTYTDIVGFFDIDGEGCVVFKGRPAQSDNYETMSIYDSVREKNISVTDIISSSVQKQYDATQQTASERPNDYGTTVVIYSMTEESNDYGTTVII